MPRNKLVPLKLTKRSLLSKTERLQTYNMPLTLTRAYSKWPPCRMLSRHQPQWLNFLNHVMQFNKDECNFLRLIISQILFAQTVLSVSLSRYWSICINFDFRAAFLSARNRAVPALWTYREHKIIAKSQWLDEASQPDQPREWSSVLQWFLTVFCVCRAMVSKRAGTLFSLHVSLRQEIWPFLALRK